MAARPSQPADIDATLALAACGVGTWRWDPGTALLHLSAPSQARQDARWNRHGMESRGGGGHADVPSAVQAMKGGAIDFIEKPFDDVLMISAIRAALDLYDKMRYRRGEIEKIQHRLATLSIREREVLDGLLAGHPNKVIAHSLQRAEGPGRPAFMLSVS